MEPETVIKPETPITLDTAQATLDRARAFSANLPKANTINAPDLTTEPLTPPPTTTATGFAGLIESTKASITALTPKVEKGAEEIKTTFDILGSQETKREDELAAAGVPEKEAEFRRLTNTMNQKDLASRRRIEKIRGENVTGQLSEGQSIAIRDEERKHSSELADLAIVAAFAKDDFELAQNVVNERIDAETEDLNNELKSLQFFYSQNFNQLSDDRKTELLQQTAQVEREISAKESKLKEISAIQLAAAENGAPASAITAIGKSDDLTGAITAAGSWIDQTIDREPDGPGGPDVVDLAPEDERILTGAGYSVDEITDLQRTVADFGIQAALDAIDDPVRKAAAKKVYNVEDFLSLEDIQAEVATRTADFETTKKTFETIFSTSELHALAKEHGFAKALRHKSFDIKAFLKSQAAKDWLLEALKKKRADEGKFLPE